jgi:hypothetical protein
VYEKAALAELALGRIDDMHSSKYAAKLKAVTAA